MFNFYEVLDGHNMVTDAGRATTCRRQFKAPWLQINVQKMKDLPKMSQTKQPFEDFRRKKYISSLDQTTPWNTQPLNATKEDGPCNQEKLNSTKLEKTNQIETVGTLQD